MFARLLLQSYLYPNLLEGTDRVGGQLRGDKECPFSGIPKSGRVWRKVPESSARSVCVYACVCVVFGCTYIYMQVCFDSFGSLLCNGLYQYMLQFGEITK